MDNKYRYLTKIVRNMRLEKIREGDLLNENEREALRYITKHDNLILNDLVWYLNVNKALVTRICKKLASLGLISMTEGIDKRTKFLNATDEGRSYKESIQSFEIKYYESLFKNINKDELEIFFNVLEKVYIESKRIRKEARMK